MLPKDTRTVGETSQVVNFRLGCEEFGVDISSVREITTVGDITSIPKAPPSVRGVMNLRGQVIAVIDLAAHLGIHRDGELTPGARIVVAESGGQPVGMLVDSVSGVIKIPLEDIGSPPELAGGELTKAEVKGVITLERGLVVLLDLERTLAQHEIEQVDSPACHKQPAPEAAADEPLHQPETAQLVER